MHTLSRSRRALRRSGAAALLAAAATLCPAQSQHRSVRPVPQPSAPAGAMPGVAGPGTPSPAGLPSPLPHPGGLTSQFPAGLPSPLPNPTGLPSPNVPNLASPGTRPGSPPIDLGTAQTQVQGMGAAGYGRGDGAPAVLPPSGVGNGPYTALQIEQSFLGADANRDGELTRAEAQRLTIMPYSFEEMDRDHDGILTRSEYEDAVR